MENPQMKETTQRQTTMQPYLSKQQIQKVEQRRSQSCLQQEQPTTNCPLELVLHPEKAKTTSRKS